LWGAHKLPGKRSGGTDIAPIVAREREVHEEFPKFWGKESLLGGIMGGRMALKTESSQTGGEGERRIRTPSSQKQARGSYLRFTMGRA